MKKKGFTLIELMGVLVILGVLSALLIPTVGSVLKENKEKAFQKQLQSIVLAAKNFGSDNMLILSGIDDETINITLDQLRKSGYLDSEIVNPKTGKEFSNCTTIQIKKIGNSYEYTVDESTIELENCNYSSGSTVTISTPSNRYIKSGDSSSYIVIVQSLGDMDNLNSYTIDESKISLGEDTDSKYSVVGENGIYRITIIGGTKDEDISLTLKSGSIIDKYGNNVVVDDIVATQSVTIDNTAPTVPTIQLVREDGTSYNHTWTNQTVITKLSSNDSGVGGIYYQYHVDGKDFTNIPEEWIVNGGPDFQIYWSGSWNFYLRACDALGNCSESAEKYWLGIDKKAPTIATPTIESNINTSEGYRRRVIVKIEDSNSGITSLPTIKYEHSVQGTVGEATLPRLENGKYYQHFGYDEVTSNVLSMTIYATDVAGNTNSKSCKCYYSNNTCSCS